MADQPVTADGTTPSSGSPLSRTAALVSRAIHWLIGVPRLLLIGFLMLYRVLISPLYGQTCRFYPSCSQYALTAVQRHGAVRGSWLAGRRLLRCHPWNPGGIDHVPPVRSKDGCEHGVTSSGMPAQAHSPASSATESESPESQADRGVAPTDQNCAPSVSRRAA